MRNKKKSPVPRRSREDVSPGNFQAPFSSPLDSGEFPVPPRGSFGVQTFLGSPQNRRPHREAPRESVVARQPEEDADERHAVVAEQRLRADGHGSPGFRRRGISQL